MITVLGTLGNDIFNISNNTSDDRYYGRAGDDIFNVKSVDGLFINTDYGKDLVNLKGNGNFIDSLWSWRNENDEASKILHSSREGVKINIKGDGNSVQAVQIKLVMTGNGNSIESYAGGKAIITGDGNYFSQGVTIRGWYNGLWNPTFADNSPDTVSAIGNNNTLRLGENSQLTVKGHNNYIETQGSIAKVTGDFNFLDLDFHIYDISSVGYPFSSPYNNNNHQYRSGYINSLSLKGNDNTIISENTILKASIYGDNNIIKSGDGIYLGAYSSDNLTVAGNGNTITTDISGGYGYYDGSPPDIVTVKGNDNRVVVDRDYVEYAPDYQTAPDKVTVTGDRNTIFGTIDDIITVRGNDNDIHLDLIHAAYRETLGSSPDGSLLVKVLNASATNSLFLDFNYGSGETITLQKQGASLLLHVEDAVNLVSETLKITNQFVASGLFGVDSITSADGFTIDLRDMSFIASASTVPSEWDASFWHSVV
jgi:hypothetical protein